MFYKTEDLIKQMRLVREAEKLETRLADARWAAIDRLQDERARELSRLYTLALERTARRIDHYDRMGADIHVITTADVRAWVFLHIKKYDHGGHVLDIARICADVCKELDLWTADKAVPDWLYGCVLRAVRQVKRKQRDREQFFVEPTPSTNTQRVGVSSPFQSWSPCAASPYWLVLHARAKRCT